MKVIDAIGAVQSVNDNVSSVYVDKYRWRGGVVKNFNILDIFSISMIVIERESNSFSFKEGRKISKNLTVSLDKLQIDHL